MIESKVIAHSVNPMGMEIVTFLNTGPRFIHSEVMTHRGFSRNAASSRAIPIEKMVQAVIDRPALPERWGVKAKKGMQDGGVMSPEQAEETLSVILHMAQVCVGGVMQLNDLGVSKQIANRYIEPWAHISVLITTTFPALANFFGLRAHRDADPTFQVLAYRMLDAYRRSDSHLLNWGEWHLPLIDLDAADSFSIEEKLKIATALALRTSYSKFDEELPHDKAFQMHDRAASVGHWSAFEHCAKAVSTPYAYKYTSNFDVGTENGSGWYQYRKQFDNECLKLDHHDLAKILADKPDWITL